MKEFSVVFKEGFKKGLWQHERTPRNNETLSVCYNLKPAEGGLRAYDNAYNRLTNPLSAVGVVIDWPFPQVFIGQDVRVLATATKIYEVSSGWAITEKLTVTENERWDFIDFGSYIILTNGTKLCIRDYAGAWTANDYTSTIPRFATGCNYNGQIVAGNIKSTWHGCGSGSLIWSRIGQVDFTPGGDNEAGFRNIPWEGGVLRTKKLGKGVMVYCENGVGVLLPHAQTWGFKELMDVGLDFKGALGGSENVHLFMGRDRNLYRVNAKYEIQRLGYRNLLYNEPQDYVVIEHDPLRREFHISGDETYVLTEYGMATCRQRKMSTIFSINRSSYGVSSDVEDDTAYIVTDPMDFGLRGMKTIQTIELSGEWGDADDSIEAAIGIYTRNDASGSWTFGPYGMVNPNGVFSMPATGVEFIIVILFSDYGNNTEVTLDSMTIRVKLSDKRYVRGIYNVA